MTVDTELLIDLAREAGDAILRVYATDFTVQSKDDESPLTRADLAANDIIVRGLRALDPATPILTEESGLPDFDTRSQWQRYWLVDPLDGTREFVNRNGEFTVNIALVEGHQPVLGVVHVPVQSLTYVGEAGTGAFRIGAKKNRVPVHVAMETGKRLRVVASRSHRSDRLDGWLATIGPHEIVPVGSSLKFCYVAQGDADVYPRLGPTSEWDTAAAQAVVEAAGGQVVTLDGQPLQYNTKADVLNPEFMVFGREAEGWLSAARQASGAEH